MKKQSTHVDPPTDAESSNEISNKNTQKAINDPVMGDAHVAKIMSGKDELMPHEAEKDGRGDKPLVRVSIRGQGAEEHVAQDFGTIACEIRSVVETGVCDAAVKFAVRF